MTGVEPFVTVARNSRYTTTAIIVWCIAAMLVLAGVGFASQKIAAAHDESASRLITVYDRGLQSAFLTEEKTVSAALKGADIQLDPRDTVEPSRDEPLIASEYHVNIYRARPVVVEDGRTRTKVMTPYQTAGRIAQDANIVIHPEDTTTVSRSVDFIGDGAGLRLSISRATVFTLDLYGRTSEARTREKTVGAMLKQKGIILGEIDRVSLPLDTPIAAGMSLRVWREGRQTITNEQPIAFKTEFVYDADRPLGYRAVQVPGILGVQVVTYDIEIKDGKEVSKKEIARQVAKNPSTQKLTIGIKGLEAGLTKSKGAQYWTDSKGVTHRETYYDLNMRVVMQSCGQGGRYTVRFDGMKIDSDGYIIIAANYGLYPKCSIVETSAGPGRVYDTGGFAAKHPTGFDLATDWSRADGI